MSLYTVMSLTRLNLEWWTPGAQRRSCQHRLKYAKNPSAVVMIAIRGVAAKVGRRYYGTRETAEGDETQVVGELKMSLARTVAGTSHDMS